MAEVGTIVQDREGDKWVCVADDRWTPYPAKQKRRSVGTRTELLERRFGPLKVVIDPGDIRNSGRGQRQKACVLVENELRNHTLDGIDNISLASRIVSALQANGWHYA